MKDFRDLGIPDESSKVLQTTPLCLCRLRLMLQTFDRLYLCFNIHGTSAVTSNLLIILPLFLLSLVGKTFNIDVSDIGCGLHIPCKEEAIASR